MQEGSPCVWVCPEDGQHLMEAGLGGVGHYEKYKTSDLVSAIAVYNSKQANDIAGLTPLNRLRGFEKAKRRET